MNSKRPLGEKYKLRTKEKVFPSFPSFRQNISPFARMRSRSRKRMNFRERHQSCQNGLTVDDSDDAEDAQQQRSRAHFISFLGRPPATKEKQRETGANSYVVLSSIVRPRPINARDRSRVRSVVSLVRSVD